MNEKKPPATDEQRAKWKATNDVREALVGKLRTRGPRQIPNLKRFKWKKHFDNFGETPRRVVQFWDKNPPDQVADMFEHTKSVCQAAGYEHTVYDLDTARARIAELAGPEWVDHYDRACHPAMQADLFRIIELRARGGYYMDADMALAMPFPFAPPPVPLFVQWADGQRTNVANWFLCTPPGHPVYDVILASIKARLARAEVLENGNYARLNLLAFTGPGPVSRSVEAYLRLDPARKDVAVMPVRWCHTFVQPARKFLKAPVEYKAKGLHWKLEKK